MVKKILSVFFTIGLLFCFVGCITEKDDGNYLPEDFIDSSYDTSFTPQNRAQEIVYNMQFGWNLGNTLDATHWQDLQNAGLSTETDWGQPKTTQEMIKGLKNLGIKSIRIPISWHNHLADNNYTIDSDWMKRVKQIVDWAYDEGMYVIINIHHDNYDSKKKNFGYGKGFYPSSECKEESFKFITRVWEQVSETFKDYDEKLVFEILNEPRLQGDEHEWGYKSGCSTCKDAMNSLNEFNQNALDTIRASGGNNATRLVMIPSLCASPDAAFNSDFKMPEDSAENALALSVHMYTPYNFAMGTPNGGEIFTSDDKGTLDRYFSELNKLYVSKGIPVVIGEMGATNKDNLKHRAAWFGYFVQHSRKYGMTACVWDNGSWDTSNIAHGDKNDNGLDDKYEEKYGYYNRTKQEWYFPLLMEVALKASEIK